MTDQHPGYREDWDITSEAGSLCFASAIYSRLVGGEQDEATLQWLAKYLRANAAPQHITVMTDQHQHHATPEQWAKVKDYAPGMEVCSCLLELHDRIQQLESSQHAHIESYQPPKPANQHRAKPEQWAFTESRGVGDPVYATCSCLIELRARVEALEATQHAHIEAKAAEAGARCAVEQLRSKPGSWQRIKTETTYGSDASIPKLSEHRAPDEWLLHSYKVGPAEPVEDWGKGFTQVRTPDPAAGAQVGRSSAAVDRVLALQDQIRDGTLTLADALKEIGASEPAKDPFRRPSLADTLADTHHCSFFNTSVLIRAFKDWLTQEGKAPLAMRELLEAQAQIAESDSHA